MEIKGLECVFFSSDIDKDVQEAYKRNFGDKPYGDITEISETKIPKHDILCVGFPCQSFSISGKRLGIGDVDLYEIIRIVQYHKPYILWLVNVKNILNINNGSVIETIDQKLDEIGYKVYRNVLNASLFGVSQTKRKSLFCLFTKRF